MKKSENQSGLEGPVNQTSFEKFKTNFQIFYITPKPNIRN